MSEPEPEIAEEWENFIHFICSSSTVLLIVAGVLWHLRRKKKPLTARIPLLMYSTLIGCMIQNLVVWTIPHHNRSLAINLIAAFLQWVSLPLTKNPYVWRVFQLFFLYRLTENHIKSATADQGEGNNVRDSISPEEDSSEKDNDKDLEKQEMVQEDWYSRHRSLVSQKSMTRSYIFINTFLCLILGGLAMIIILMDVSFYAIHGSIQTLYVIIALALVVVIRNVQDAFFLKREFLGVAIFWTLQMVTAFGLSTGLGIPTRYGLFMIYLEPYFTVIISFAIPLKMSKSKAFKNSSRSTTEATISLGKSNDEENTKSMSSYPEKTYKSLDAIITNPQLADAFVNEVRKYFVVQNVYFLQQLIAWKSCQPELLAGKALLLYQKYIKPMSLLDMNVPEELRADIEAILLDEDKLVNATITTDFFEEIERFVRKRLEDPLRQFRHSPEYAKVLGTVLESERLETGMKQVGIMH